MAKNTFIDGLSNIELLAETERLAASSRELTAQLVVALAEVERRSLHLAVGYMSLTAYCREVLRLSEHAAYARIEAARLVHRFPEIADLLVKGELTLTTVGLLGPVLTEENHGALLNGARNKSRREVEMQVAAIRQLPPLRASVKAISRDLYAVQFTIIQATYEKLTYVQNMRRHQCPSGDIAATFDAALTALIRDAEKNKFAATNQPRARENGEPWSRHIPAAVKRDVWKRDGGRCAFVGTHGRCQSRAFLEYHHLVPFAAGGSATVENIELRCRAHNIYEAETFFGGGSGVVREPMAAYSCGNSVRTELLSHVFLSPTES
jgi:5-methylcytosine-specific restriction endonuclease McrA